MGSTEINIGYTSNTKCSSRVLKPPGGGHSNIFEEPELKANPPRPKYNQQNSSNLNAVMGTVDPNIKQAELIAEISPKEKEPEISPKSDCKPISNDLQNNSQPSGRSRVPPGGFSSGLW